MPPPSGLSGIIVGAFERSPTSTVWSLQQLTLPVGLQMHGFPQIHGSYGVVAPALVL